MIRTSAPGRAGIIGNPTDGYGGSVISCSLKERAYTEIREDSGLVFEVSQQEFRVNSRDGLKLKGDGDIFDFLRAILIYLKLGDLKARVTSWSDVPFQAGLAGSTAIMVSALNAILEFTGRKISLYERAELTRTIELNFMKIQCGYQDAYMTTFGGLNYMDFRTKEHYREFHREIYATVEPLHNFASKLPIVLAQTKVRRISGAVLKPIRDRWLEGDKAVINGYNRIAELCRLGKKAIIANDWQALGDLMNENHSIQQELGASGHENDRLIEFALNYGALGAKLAGAGGGGTIVALHPEPEKLGEQLLRNGAVRTLYPEPSPGVTIENL